MTARISQITDNTPSINEIIANPVLLYNSIDLNIKIPNTADSSEKNAEKCSTLMNIPNKKHNNRNMNTM